jgi:hypothetical protein
MSIVMAHLHVRFIINELTELEIKALKNDEVVVSKMILVPDDYKLFHYRKGDSIEVQTAEGYRLWCFIEELEVVADQERIILIFTLRHNAGNTY